MKLTNELERVKLRESGQHVRECLVRHTAVRVHGELLERRVCSQDRLQFGAPYLHKTSATTKIIS